MIDFDSACGDIDDLVEESLAQGMECLSNVGGEGDRMNVQLASLMMYPQHYKYSRQASNSVGPFGLSEVLNHRFRITCSDSETGVSLDSSVQGYMSSCHEEFPLLYLSSSYMNSSESETSKKETVFHEMLHALGFTHSDIPDRTFACSRLCFEDFIDNDARDGLEDYCNGTVTTEDSDYWDNMFSVNQIGDATVLTSIRYSRTPESVSAIAQYLDSLTNSEFFLAKNLEMAFRELALNTSLNSPRYAHQDRFIQAISNLGFNSQDVTMLRSLGQRYLNGDNVDRDVDNFAEQFYNRRLTDLQSRLSHGLISQSDYNSHFAATEDIKEALEASFVSH